MTSAVPVITLSPRDYDVVLFDLDGVLTRSASVHAAAWKKLFDGFLEQHATQADEPFVPFDIATDYPRYVDGKPRYDGVAAFLASRGIDLPLGTLEDGPEVQSVHALGKLKDRYFQQHLEQDGIEPYEAAIALVRTLRAQEIKTAVVSSSNNCAAVLEAAGIAQLFDTRVDGKDVTRLELKGKPAPDAFLEAARRLKVEPARQVLAKHLAVLQDPEPSVLVDSLAPSAVNLRVYFWMNGRKHSWLKVRSSVIRLVKRAFQEHGITMPDDAREIIFPQGVPVTVIDRTAAAEPAARDAGPRGQRPAAAPAEDTDAVSTQAEAGLYSEAVVIEAQARQAPPLQSGENLLATAQDHSTKSL